MTLYEIAENLMRCFDPESGELVDVDAFESLQLERDQKIENIACWIKDLNADAAAIREEEKSLADRRRAMENKSENLKQYLGRFMGIGEKYSSARCAVSWRRSTKVNVDINELYKDPRSENYLLYHDPEPNKTAIREAIKAGFDVRGDELVESQNLQIK